MFERVLLLAATALLVAARTQAMVAPTPGPGGSYGESVLQSGAQWELVQSTGYDENGVYFSTTLFKMQGTTGINNAPLPASLKRDLLASSPAGSTNAIVVSRTLVDEVVLSEQQGYLTPTLQGIAEPPDDGGPLPVAARGEASTLRLFGRCRDQIVTRSKSFDFGTPLDRNWDLGSGFSANVALTGDARVTATGVLEVAKHRFAIFGVCIPIGARFNYARAYGSAHIDLGTTLTGTVNFSKSWEWEIAKPKLFSFTFAIGYVPVHIGFNLPITAGLDLSASAAASVTFTGADRAQGSFDYTCRLNGCTGWSSFITVNPRSQTVTAGLTGRVQPTVWAQVAVRGYLYDEEFAYAQMGLRGFVHGDLWGYYGNNCGDANADNIFETVNALTFDLDWQLKLTAQADSFLTNKKTWVLNDFGRKHIRFWEIDTATALTPELKGAASVPISPAPSFGGKMRPCWPYSDSVNYRMAWGDGTTSSFSGPPQTTTNVSHAYPSTGAKTLTLTALGDVHGRTFSNKNTSRNITVTPGVNTSLDMTCYPMGSISGCGVAGYWASIYPLQFLYSSSNSSLQIVYPSGGSFPYSTNNGVIYFGLPGGSGLGRCPAGTQITMSAWHNSSFVGTVTRSCP